MAKRRLRVLQGGRDSPKLVFLITRSATFFTSYSTVNFAARLAADFFPPFPPPSFSLSNKDLQPAEIRAILHPSPYTLSARVFTRETTGTFFAPPTSIFLFSRSPLLSLDLSCFALSFLYRGGMRRAAAELNTTSAAKCG